MHIATGSIVEYAGKLGEVLLPLGRDAVRAVVAFDEPVPNPYGATCYNPTLPICALRLIFGPLPEERRAPRQRTVLERDTDREADYQAAQHFDYLREGR